MACWLAPWFFHRMEDDHFEVQLSNVGGGANSPDFCLKAARNHEQITITFIANYAHQTCGNSQKSRNKSNNTEARTKHQPFNKQRD